MKRAEHSHVIIKTHFEGRDIDKKDDHEIKDGDSSVQEDGLKGVVDNNGKKEGKTFEGDFFKDFYYSQGNYTDAKKEEKHEEDKA